MNHYLTACIRFCQSSYTENADNHELLTMTRMSVFLLDLLKLYKKGTAHWLSWNTSILGRKIIRDIVDFFKELFIRLTFYEHDLLELARPPVLKTGNCLAGANARMQDRLHILSVIRFLFNSLLLQAKHHLPPVPLRPRR